jgi:hypothetical protein
MEQKFVAGAPELKPPGKHFLSSSLSPYIHESKAA